MLLKKSKVLIYMILSLFILTFMLPVLSFAIDEDSIYVWSNNSSSIQTSNITNLETQTTTQDNSRKFFRNHFRRCHIN